MEVQDRSRSPSRRTSRVEQVVGRWLRRSRDLGSRSHSLSRDRVTVDGKTAESTCTDQRNYSFRFNVQIQRDPNLNSHGLTLTTQSPLLVQEITPGGPADGRLVPGDQLVKINNVAVDDLTPEQAAEIIRECQDSLTVTALRTMLGPKSSFITPEKRAKLRSNPVKVHFAEEVEVNGHSQGNSLLFLPNVLKVYMENGQTKAFKFEPSTTVKDIVMTLKEKLSLSRIEHFSLVLEQQHNVSKLLLLHDEERIQQVVQKKEAHDYRCLFRVCFMPKNLQVLLQEDPTAFMYLYLQGVNDVLQERFAVEMRCNTALRLAALHIQERLASCGQSPKTNLKTITKNWGIDNFVSSTLLRNMREKDLRKAIAYHMKKSQSQHDPKLKVLSVDQARINYLEELKDLKSFGGKCFSATMMLQDRESMVTLLVGARYGVSQVVNHKLSILSTLTEFISITRIELLPESDKVSLVKIYLQDIKPITLLLESVAAKDMSCLIAGYCRLFVDPNLNIFPWVDDSKRHRVSAEEGYVSRCGSDSDNSDLDMEPLVAQVSNDEKPRPRIRSSSDPEGRKRKDKNSRCHKDDKEKPDEVEREEKYADTKTEYCQLDKKTYDEDGEREREQEGQQILIKISNSDFGGKDGKTGDEEQMRATEEQPPASEASDSCQSDSHNFTSPSSDSFDALEEDNLISCSSSTVLLPASSQPQCPLQLHHYPHGHVQPRLLAPPPFHSHPLIQYAPHDSGGRSCSRSSDGANPQFITTISTSPSLQLVKNCSENLCSSDSSLCFAELSRLVDFLPSPPEVSEDDDDGDQELRRKVLKETDELMIRISEDGSVFEEGHLKEQRLSPSPPSPSPDMDFIFNFDQGDARCYYNLCSSITPDSAHSLPHSLHHDHVEDWEEVKRELEPIPILQPPPGFGDSSSDDEFFDARDRFTSPEDPTSGAMPRDICTEMKLDFLSTLSLNEIGVSVTDVVNDVNAEEDGKIIYEEGGPRGTLFQLRKRPRKRRSFMETDYTSRVSFPDPEPEQDQVFIRVQKNLLAGGTEAQMLSSDPEPSKQTENPSPTVSSLTHSEGEPAQLELKPILSTTRLHGSGSPSGFGSPKQARDTDPTCRTRKQEMEMEPDAMESKSVIDLVKVALQAITVVRCRVDPDGKECSDRRGDGKEEGEGQEDFGEENLEGEKEETICMSEHGLFTSNMFLPEISLEEDKDKLEKSYSKRTVTCAERELETNTLPVCLLDEYIKHNNSLLGAHLISLEQNSHVEENIIGVYETSDSPPPAPPSSPLPPVIHESRSHFLLMEEGSKQNKAISMELFLTKSKEMSLCQQNHTNEAHLHLEVTTCDNENEAISVLSSTMTNSDEVTDSTNSDNVFDDDEAYNSLNSNSTDKKYDGTLTKHSISANSPADKDESLITIRNQQSSEPHSRLHSFNADYTHSINSITAKLGAATNIASPIFNSGMKLKSEFTKESAYGCQNVEKSRNDSTPGIVEPKLTSASLVKANTDMADNLSKDLPSPKHFLFQACSSTIMGRLSASTLRGKIQKLPLYLSRSQETLNQAGLAESPDEDHIKDSVEITITDVDDVTQTIEVEMDTAAESVESDDSDTTVTGSEVDGEFFLETTSAKSFYSLPELKEINSLMPVQTESKQQQQNQLLHPGPSKSTPGPVTKPPSSIVNSFKSDIPGPKIDTPGPIKTFPPTFSSAIVVTTQTLNGPGFPFHSQSETVRRSSGDRPLIGLCGPTGQNSNSSKTPSPACSVFTICEDSSQKQAKRGPSLPLKSEPSCSSLLVSGCESVVEGMQLPLDTCGCPVVYTNCFSSGDSFDEELTVYEFSCRTQSSSVTPTPASFMSPVPSFVSTSSTHPPFFPHSSLFSSSTSELSPLLSPLSETSPPHLSQTHKDTISQLAQKCYPEPPAGFQVLRVDVDHLLSILEDSSIEQSVASYGGRHPKDTCPAHFGENKQILQLEARRLMLSSQKVVGIGQTPEEMLHSLAESFRTLVELAGICLWFSGCDRCDRRNAEAVTGLADVTRSFRDFCLAAERVSSKRSCHDLSIKLLAKQCTALTASVFCLTQLFRTLTAL